MVLAAVIVSSLWSLIVIFTACIPPESLLGLYSQSNVFLPTSGCVVVQRRASYGDRLLNLRSPFAGATDAPYATATEVRVGSSLLFGLLVSHLLLIKYLHQ